LTAFLQCDQQAPCSNCSKTSAICVYDEGRDGRRRSARKRAVEELELKRDALDTILEALRNSDESQLQHLLWLIKKDVPLDEIIQYSSTIDEGFEERRNSSEGAFQIGSTQKNNVLSISAMLTDYTPIRVPAAPWTTITKDDDLVSHLVSVYFTWYHPAYPCLVRELFVRDMVAADPTSQFCSPIIVNAMLATACVRLLSISLRAEIDASSISRTIVTFLKVSASLPAADSIFSKKQSDCGKLRQGYQR